MQQCTPSLEQQSSDLKWPLHIYFSFYPSQPLTCPLFLSLCLQPDELTNVLEICNIVFTSMFTLEMILKLTAFGFFEYLRNPYNIFDGIIVIIR